MRSTLLHLLRHAPQDDTHFATSDTFPMETEQGGGVDTTCTPEENDDRWWDPGCLRGCNGSLGAGCPTTSS